MLSSELSSTRTRSSRSLQRRALKLDLRTRNVPTIIHSSKPLGDDERRGLEEGAAAILPKQSLSHEVALARIRDALLTAGARPQPA